MHVPHSTVLVLVGYLQATCHRKLEKYKWESQWGPLTQLSDKKMRLQLYGRSSATADSFRSAPLLDGRAALPILKVLKMASHEATLMCS